MATHDYVIDNQTAPNLRADLNNALQAIVTQNSSATAPTVTYADMIWYDTANNQIKKRNEANSGWITLGTIDETGGTFLPNAIASQSEAEAGAATNKLMTPERTKQAINANLTTSTVLAATAGASAGGIGTYVFGEVGTTSVAFGATIAGSALSPGSTNSGGNFSSGTLSGTWRCMGSKATSNSLYTVWLRIS